MIFYYIIINIITFIVFYLDKNKARKNKWRISESQLFILIYIGGGLGALLGMLLFKHKTKKFYFYLTIIFSLVFHFLSNNRHLVS